MSKKKKIIIILSMVAILAVAAYVNIALLSNNDDQNNVDDEVPTGSFFATYRDYRQTTRSYEITQLDSIINTEGEEYAQARQDAMDQKLKLIEIADMELLLETLLRAQGFEDAVVSIGATSNNVSIIVSADELTRQQTAQIYNIITEELDTTTDYIRIQSI